MDAFDALILFAACVVGSAAVWLIANCAAVWKRRRDEDARFQHSLALGGVHTEVGAKTGIHAFGTVTVGEVLEQETAAEMTMDLPLTERGAVR